MPTGKTFGELVALAAAHHGAGRLREAEANYRAALALSPGHAAVVNNLGVIAATEGRQIDARALFDDAIAREPGHVAAHYNRGSALIALGRTDDAIRSFERVCALDPGHYEAHRALGFLWLEGGDRGRSLDHFARTYELRRGDDRLDGQAKFLTFATRRKLAHDAEQFRYLGARRRDRARFDALARAYEDGGAGFSGSRQRRFRHRSGNCSAMTTTPRSPSPTRRNLPTERWLAAPMPRS